MPDIKKLPKMDMRCALGGWHLAGKRPESDEHIVGTPSGIRYGRSARRLAEGEMPVGLFEAMRWTPWTTASDRTGDTNAQEPSGQLVESRLEQPGATLRRRLR
eukprot:599992-Heterocapsa_arctica.AAC.1